MNAKEPLIASWPVEETALYLYPAPSPSLSGTCSPSLLAECLLRAPTERRPLPGLSPIRSPHTAHAKIAVWEPGPAPPTPQHLAG
jgi:hypothetical protein